MKYCDSQSVMTTGSRRGKTSRRMNLKYVNACLILFWYCFDIFDWTKGRETTALSRLPHVSRLVALLCSAWRPHLSMYLPLQAEGLGAFGESKEGFFFFILIKFCRMFITVQQRHQTKSCGLLGHEPVSLSMLACPGALICGRWPRNTGTQAPQIGGRGSMNFITSCVVGKQQRVRSLHFVPFSSRWVRTIYKVNISRPEPVISTCHLLGRSGLKKH